MNGKQHDREALPWRVIVTVVVGVGASLFAVVAAFWLWNSGRTEPGEIVQPTEVHAVSLVVSGDTNGWIVPCGCTSNQSGGMPRRGTLVEQLRASHDGVGTDVAVVDVVVADVGGAPGGDSVYERIKFEAILAGEAAMGVVAHNLGGREIDLGVDYLRSVADRTQAPLISANARTRGGELLFEGFRLVERGGRQILLIGVVSPSFSSAEVEIGDPRDAILSIVDNATESYDSLVVLAYLPEQELRQLASHLPEADVIVGGPTGQSIAPLSVGPTLLASATNKGKFVVHLTFTEETIWSGEVIELSAEFADAPSQAENLASYRDTLERLDLSAQQSGFVTAFSASAPVDYSVAGTSSCLPCHENDCQVWADTGHAIAWQTLSANRSHVDSYCQQCHTTSYGLPGGFASAGRSADRTSVGCESCHGPANQHAQDPSTPTPYRAADQCSKCHDRENSPGFDYEEYWQRITHGKE
jgi:hypothetical protein